MCGGSTSVFFVCQISTNIAFFSTLPRNISPKMLILFVITTYLILLNEKLQMALTTSVWVFITDCPPEESDSDYLLKSE